MLKAVTFLVTSLTLVSNALASDVQCKWKHENREIAVVFRVDNSKNGQSKFLDRRDGRLLPMQLQSLEGLQGAMPKGQGLEVPALSQQRVLGVNGDATVVVFMDANSRKPTASLNGRYVVSLEAADKRSNTRAELDIVALIEAPSRLVQDKTVFTGTAMITMETEVKGANDFTIGAGRRVSDFTCTKLSDFNFDDIQL